VERRSVKTFKNLTKKSKNFIFIKFDKNIRKKVQQINFLHPKSLNFYVIFLPSCPPLGANFNHSHHDQEIPST